MLGRVKQQALHRRWKLPESDKPSLGQCLGLCRTQLIERTLDLDVERIEELIDGDGRIRRRSFLAKRRSLLVR